MRPGLCRASSGPEASMGLPGGGPCSHPQPLSHPCSQGDGGRAWGPRLPSRCPCSALDRVRLEGSEGSGCRAQREQPRPLWSVSVHPGGCPRGDAQDSSQGRPRVPSPGPGRIGRWGRQSPERGCKPSPEHACGVFSQGAVRACVCVCVSVCVCLCVSVRLCLCL